MQNVNKNSEKNEIIYDKQINIQKKTEGAVRISTTGNEMTMWICGIRRSSRRYGESDPGLTGCKNDWCYIISLWIKSQL